jgi:hypothetical protein
MKIIAIILSFGFLISANCALAQDVGPIVETTDQYSPEPEPLTNIPLIPEGSRFYKPGTENPFGLFPNKRRNLNQYLAAQQYAEPLSDAEIAASKAEDGIIEAPTVLTPRVGIDLER